MPSEFHPVPSYLFFSVIPMKLQCIVELSLRGTLENTKDHVLLGCVVTFGSLYQNKIIRVFTLNYAF